MRETRSYGSVRGVRSNPYPYRDLCGRTGLHGFSFAQVLGRKQRVASSVPDLDRVFLPQPVQDKSPPRRAKRRRHR